ncbi:molybdate ABC transporter substrate-binding protein [uncultured Desulfobacter sp.]|uniref:molybdate ABC transporter substrate-binding protein n=1 Tax=uncultured Desulfobacter sp. TaxID=240139 RepID=UPI002AAA7491|nr:molybdate ABC transporter substrate-binding protein [uncultured Desulfobacter sp.]
MKKFLPVLVLIGICLFFVLGAWADELFLYAGAGLRKPTDKIIARFEQETGHKVIVDYGGSGKQMATYQTVLRGDLFMPGSCFYIDRLREKGLVLSDSKVVLHTPVIAVNKKGNHGIKTLEDMAAPGIKLAMGDPKAMALGRTTVDIIKNAGLEKQFLGNVAVYGATVNQLTLYVVQRAVDAAIVARSNAFMHKDALDIFDIPPKYYTPEIIGIAVLKSTKNTTLAEQFKTFVAGPRGSAYFTQFGFLPLQQ